MTDETQEVKICPTCSVQWAPREPNVIKITNQRIWLLSPIPCPDCDERQKEWLADVGRGIAEKLEIAVLPDLAEKHQQMNAESVKAWRSLMDVGIDETFWRAFVKDHVRQQFEHLQRMFNACSSANDVLLKEKLQFDKARRKCNELEYALTRHHNAVRLWGGKEGRAILFIEDCKKILDWKPPEVT